MLSWERKAFLKGFSVIIGVDEAGRGPLAGPVVAGAVILGRSPLKRFKAPEYKENIDDSKKLLPRQREKAFMEISTKAVFGIGIKDNKYIDRVNIHMATLAAMKQAVETPLPPPNVTFAPVIHPSEVAVSVTNEVQTPIVNVTNTVQPAPVENNITVEPSDVVIQKEERKPRKATVKRGADGKITEIESK